jgi:peptidoglycan/LPS O-acetylase OafA/YrhL
MEKKGLNRDIEILRAVAILMVLVQHFPSLYFWSDHSFFSHITSKVITFWSGVDVFLCISGFVVSGSLMRVLDNAKDNGGSSSLVIKQFFIKRIFRLLPTTWFWIALLLVMTFTYNISGAFGKINWNIYQALSVLTYNYNFLSSFMTNNNLPTTFGPFWSLNLEEQFYFIFPFFILFTNKKYRIFYLLTFIAMQFFIHRQGNVTLNIRLDAISWGVALSILHKNGILKKAEPIILCSRLMSATFTVVCLAYLMLSIPLLSESRFMVGLLAAFSALLVYAASYDKGYIYCPKHLKRIMLWFGSRSFGIYVIHMPVIYIIQESTIRILMSQGIGPSGSLLLCSVMSISAIVLIAILVEVNYRFLEVPLRDHGRNIARRMNAAS